jgi:hypothetical protein
VSGGVSLQPSLNSPPLVEDPDRFCRSWGELLNHHAQGLKLFLAFGSSALVFSATYLRGSFAPSAFPSTGSGLRFPPKISREKTALSHQSLQKKLYHLSPLQGGIVRPPHRWVDLQFSPSAFTKQLRFFSFTRITVDLYKFLFPTLQPIAHMPI